MHRECASLIFATEPNLNLQTLNRFITRGWVNYLVTAFNFKVLRKI